MYVDPTKPLPNPTEKKDYLGSVLDVLLKIHYARIESIGDELEFKDKITTNTLLANQKLDQYGIDIDNALKAHTDLRGAVHGETKQTVGLGNKDNWRFATTQEHIDAQSKTTYANPQGLKAMVESRLTIDPKKYIRSRIIPIASGGQLGSVPQWPWNWQEGEVVQSPTDPMNFFGDTPWQFRTDSGLSIFPCLNGSDVLTQVTADPGRQKRVILPWGGTNIRIYNRSLDMRRSRPSYLRAESSNEPNNQLLKASAHLFDRHAAFYADPNMVGARGFNRYRLPFDTISNGDKWKNNWSGILEARERFLYNIVSNLVYGNIGGYGLDLYLTIEFYPYTFTQDGIDVINGSGRAAETTALIQDTYGTVTYSLPASNKIKTYTQTGKPLGLCIKLRDIVTYTDTQMSDLINAVNTGLSKQIAFAWRNRLKGEFALRIPVGFYSKDKKYYTNYYVDLGMQVTENTTAKTAAVTVTELRDLTSNKQTLNSNLQVTATGKFVQYPAAVAGDVFHPLVFNGVFDSLGGHVKTYTFYNRQYVGYYQHDVDSVLDWINGGDVIKPTLTKYQYNQLSTLNQDGFYGDHLRHIPLSTDGTTIDYLTYSRDWRHNYRYAITNVDIDTAPEMLTPSGQHHGPWRNEVTWIEPKNNLVPSFIISNNEANSLFDNNCLVFNTQNSFTGYARYGYDANNDAEPLTWLDPVSMDPLILTWIAQNGGAWLKNHKQMFYYRGSLYWFSQTLDPDEIKADGTDCYYGIIKNAIIDVQGSTRTLKINGDIAANATANPLKVNTKASLGIDTRNVVGWDTFTHTDVYAMLMERNGNISRYQLMVNLAPFNNFYFEFETTIDTGTGNVTFLPNSKAVDPVFPYNASTGFAVDYNTVTAYGTKTPHQFHINFQTPVMLKKAMWSMRKTPGNYGLFATSIGTVITAGGLMSSVRGVPIYPVGSVATVGGSNLVVKEPISAADDYFDSDDELFLKLDGTASLYGRRNNPNNYVTEPSSGVVPCGFLKNGVFYHYDPEGWRTDLLPVIDGKRMSFYGYGSTFPALLGVSGSGLPVNRYFLTDKPTIFTWQPSLGRSVPVGPGNIKVFINNVEQPYGGSGVFTIPAAFTDIIDISVTGQTTVKWGSGMIFLKQIGNTVTNLDFTNSATFTILASLPKRITSLKGIFRGGNSSFYNGIEKWDTSNVTDMSEMFADCLHFNQALPWDTRSVTTMESMFENAGAFNGAIGTWNVSNVRTMKNMFKDTDAFNGDLSTWNTIRVSDFSYMFNNALKFNGNIKNWNVTSGINFEHMFDGAAVFNIDIGTWTMSGAQRLSAMFKNAVAFNGPIGTWDVGSVVYMDEMFSGAIAFARSLAAWRPARVTTMYQMFMGTVLFGVNGTSNLSNWTVDSLTDATRMFSDSQFNSPMNNWKFGQDANLTGMFMANTVFNQNISSWNMVNVKTMYNMFNSATAFNTSITGWQLDSCEEFSYMFANSNFNGSVANWTLSTTVAISMVSMFTACPLFTGTGIETWNTGRVITFLSMFNGASVFNGNISTWNVGSCTDFRNMFRNAYLFNQNLGSWDMRAATDISEMFRDAWAFNGAIGSWSTSTRLTAMYGIFNGAKAFNQDISRWTVSRVADFTSVFRGCVAFNQDISAWNTSSATNMTTMFYGCTVFNQDLSGWNVTKVTTRTNFAANANAWTLPKPNFV